MFSTLQRPRQFPLRPCNCTEKETEWRRFHAPPLPGNSHCAPTGSGKTAVFAQVRDLTRRQRSNVVLDLMPEGYKLRKFKETVLKGLGEGSLEHTLTAFWEYLLLLEICHKVLDKDRAVYQYEKRLTTPYRELKELYERDDYIAEGDFSERMTALLGRISDDFAARFGTSTTTLSQQEVTELLYRHDVAILREKVVA